MKYRALDQNGDYVFGNNNQDYIDGVDAIAQAIRTKILLFYGEWWENIGVGIPMFQSIIGERNPEALKQSVSLLVTERVLETPGVLSIENVEITREGRALDMTITVNTNDGPVTVGVVA